MKVTLMKVTPIACIVFCAVVPAYSLEQRADHFFGIVGIHLAAESLDVKGFFHGCFHCSGQWNGAFSFRRTSGRTSAVRRARPIGTAGTAPLNARVKGRFRALLHASFATFVFFSFSEGRFKKSWSAPPA
jgi:hypothetical protein